jgi:hypothetical protein
MCDIIGTRLKIICMEEKEKFVAGARSWPDARTD